jgi:hypothetical protein
MPDQLFAYDIEKPLWDNIYKQWELGAVMVIRLVIDFGGIDKGGIKKEGGKRGGWVGEEVWGLLGFVALVCVWVYFCCCSEGYLHQGLQGAGIVCS